MIVKGNCSSVLWILPCDTGLLVSKGEWWYMEWKHHNSQQTCSEKSELWTGLSKQSMSMSVCGVLLKWLEQGAYRPSQEQLCLFEPKAIKLLDSDNIKSLVSTTWDATCMCLLPLPLPWCLSKMCSLEKVLLQASLLFHIFPVFHRLQQVHHLNWPISSAVRAQ